MAIILGENDLNQLYQTPAAMDDLLNLIEASLGAHGRDEVAGQIRVETSLVDTKRKYRIMTAAVPGAGFAARISALFRGAKNAYFHLLFDNDSGDLLALVAGRELNIWRTGAPGGVAARHLAPPHAKTLGLLGRAARRADSWSLPPRSAVPRARASIQSDGSASDRLRKRNERLAGPRNPGCGQRAGRHSEHDGRLCRNRFPHARA